MFMPRTRHASFLLGHDSSGMRLLSSVAELGLDLLLFVARL